ncbi:hypothetical protein [Granulicella arctica]|uniref:Uncharacterized protein n=1 Tax=Granulicella arctica TaxID=940613 RepID=A0A7Y9PEV6_9BACT|nr:hypothetical protein [Granulicella arctica]NYF78631.1 hypothetical protein [Granulicella arctica]
MSTEPAKSKPKSVGTDPSQHRVSARKVLAEGEPQNLDSAYSCALLNDTSDAYIVTTFHDSGWAAEIWGQPPGATIYMKPGWKAFLDPVNCEDVLNQDEHGNSESYGGGWPFTTQANSTYHFSSKSF